MGVSLCGYYNICVFMCVFKCVFVIICGYCNVCVCVSVIVGFIFCGYVCVWVL